MNEILLIYALSFIMQESCVNNLFSMCIIFTENKIQFTMHKIEF